KDIRCGYLSPKDSKSGNRDIIGRSGLKLSNSLRGRKSCFKIFRNLRIPLANSMKAVVELLSSQVSGKAANDA
ncbi:hypothetical protein E1A91_A01G148000v1, partial [Gossypium mustelinum]